MAQALELSDVLMHVRVSPPDRVSFRETRFNPLLEKPMKLSGYLEYPKTGQLRKVIEAPFQETMMIDGDAIELIRDGRTKRISLRNRKSMLTMLQSIESILAGDAEKIEQAFDVELNGSADSWELRLEPIAERLAKQLAALTVWGGGTSIARIRFDMQNGEWQHLEIAPSIAEP